MPLGLRRCARNDIIDHMNRILIAAAVSAALLSSTAAAQSWSELNSQQQRQLADFQPIWAQLTDNRRARLVNSAVQISRMSPTNRAKLVDSIRQANGGNGQAEGQR